MKTFHHKSHASNEWNSPFQLLQIGEQTLTRTYRMQLPGGTVLPLTVNAYKFCNPYNDEFEYLVATHTAINPS